MPNNLQDDQRHNWSETDYMSALSNVVSLGGAEAPSTNAPTHSSGSGMGMRFNILGKINEIASVASDALGVRKPMLNPGYFQNYTGSGLRNFNFSYDFIPKNSDEALQITKIVQAFKQYSSPQKGLHVTGSSEIDKYIYQAEDEYTLNPAKSSDFRFGTNSAIEEARMWIQVELEDTFELPGVTPLEDLILKEGEFVRNIAVTIRLTDGWDE